MRPINIHSIKYNGAKHWRFAAVVVDAAASCLHTYTAPGGVADTYRGAVTSHTHDLRLFWRDRPWNLVLKWRPDWSFQEYYVNIASPATWDDQTVVWTDLDLDLILDDGAAEPRLDDEDEFRRNSKAWGYPAELVTECWSTVRDVSEMMRRHQHPFDGSLTSWRPPVRT